VEGVFSSSQEPAAEFCDFFTKPDDLFTTACIRYAEIQFAVAVAIRVAVTDELMKVQKEEYSAGFQKLYDRAKVSIYANGAFLNKKGMFLPRVSSNFNKFSPKTLGPHCVF